MTTENMQEEFENEAPTEEGSGNTEKPGEEEIENESGDASTEDRETEQTDDQDLEEEQDDELDIHPDDPKGVQKRIGKLSAQKKQAQAEAAMERQRARELEARLAAYERQLSLQQQEEELVEPNIDDFPDVREYIKARDTYYLKYIERAEQLEQNRKKAEREYALALNYQKHAKIAAEKYEDFYEVTNGAQGITDAMAEIIAECDHPAEVAYYICKNPKEIQKLRQMSEREMARAIGKIESRFERSPTKVKTNASPINKQITGGGIATKTTLDHLSQAKTIAEYEAMRSKMMK